jgi:hypothetical protein
VEVVILTFGLVFGSIYSLTSVILDHRPGDHGSYSSRTLKKLRQRADGGVGTSRF